MFIVLCYYCSNLKVGYFSQHHVDSMDMKMTSVELLQSRFPGIYIGTVILHFTKML